VSICLIRWERVKMTSVHDFFGERIIWKGGKALKKHNTCLFSTVFLGLFLFTGSCATNPVSSDLIDYVNQGILGIVELERRSLASYASVIGKNFTTAERVSEALKNDVIPQYERFVESLREITPETEEVMKLHRIYVRGAEDILSGFKAKRVGIETKQEPLIRTANRQIVKGRIETEQWRRELMEMYRRYGIVEKKK
jgi:hypothetical protein